jgi:hypothetical protein
VNNRALAAAGIFTLGALIFLFWSNQTRSSAEARAEDDIRAWTRSLTPRTEFARLVGHPDLNQAASKGGTVDVPATVGEIVREISLQTEQVRIDTTSAVANEQAAYRIRINNASVAMMGEFLDRLRRQQGHLTSREITMSTLPRNAVPGVFNWSMVVGVPKARRK